MSKSCHAVFQIFLTERENYYEYGIRSICGIHGTKSVANITTDFDEIKRLHSALTEGSAECAHLECLCEDFMNLRLFPNGGYF